MQFVVHFIVALLSAPSPDLIPKCSVLEVLPGYEPNQPVVLIDGELLEDSLEELDTAEIASIDVTCWSPKLDDFGSDAPGISVIRIISRGLVAEKRASIDEFLTAQAAYIQRHGRLPISLLELKNVAESTMEAVDYSVSDSGWFASTPTDGEAFRCFVESSSASLDSEEPQTLCQAASSRGKQAMRSLYEASQRAR